MIGKPLGNRYKTHDGRTVDSTGAFLVGELERLDLTMHEPLANVTWSLDIDNRNRRQVQFAHVFVWGRRLVIDKNVHCAQPHVAHVVLKCCLDFEDFA